MLQIPDDERDQTLLRHAPMKHLVNWLILQFLVITTAYSGGLAYVLTLPRYNTQRIILKLLFVYGSLLEKTAVS